MNMNIVYLDQWVYVELLRTYKGKAPQYPKYVEICKRIIESSHDGINKFPFSLAHVIETIKRKKLSSRKELFKFIFDLSGFYTIRPWTQVINLEIRNSILKSLNAEPKDLSDIVFGNELSHCIGGKTELESKHSNKEVPTEIQEKAFDLFRDSELMSDMFCQDKPIEFFESLFPQQNELARKLEDLRKKDYFQLDKKKRMDLNDARFILEVIQDDFIRTLMEFKLDPKIYIQNIFSSKESTMAFLRTIPTAYTFHVLNVARNQNISRPIEPNDFWDLGSLAIAIPYCDVVVTEREWSNILNQKKIGELYGTKITHRIEDLSEFM